MEILKNAVKNSILSLPTDQSVKEYHEASKKNFRETEGGVSIEVGKWIVNTVGTKDGSYIQTFTDITEIQEKRIELERLSDAINTMPSGIIIWDKDQKLFKKQISKQLKSKTDILITSGAVSKGKFDFIPSKFFDLSYQFSLTIT